MNNLLESKPDAADMAADPPVYWNFGRVSAYLQLAGIPSSEVTIRRKVAAGTFPQPTRFGSRCNFWRSSDVCSYVATGGRFPA